MVHVSLRGRAEEVGLGAAGGVPVDTTASKAGVVFSVAWVATKTRWFSMSTERTLPVAVSTSIQSLTYGFVVDGVP
ncbi:hypothetical protein AB0J81_28960 [Streptomyces bobili]|uniref:hypothetical protein n=1 Tax=Streptomyces bobili TaxID=67280 RepID=UPI0034200000